MWANQDLTVHWSKKFLISLSVIFNFPPRFSLWSHFIFIISSHKLQSDGMAFRNILIKHYIISSSRSKRCQSDALTLPLNSCPGNASDVMLQSWFQEYIGQLFLERSSGQIIYFELLNESTVSIIILFGWIGLTMWTRF